MYIIVGQVPTFEEDKFLFDKIVAYGEGIDDVLAEMRKDFNWFGDDLELEIVENGIYEVIDPDGTIHYRYEVVRK